MKTQEIVQKLINGEVVFITDEAQRKEVQNRLREIKNNCTIVLSQLKSNKH